MSTSCFIPPPQPSLYTFGVNPSPSLHTLGIDPDGIPGNAIRTLITALPVPLEHGRFWNMKSDIVELELGVLGIPSSLDGGGTASPWGGRKDNQNAIVKSTFK